MAALANRRRVDWLSLNHGTRSKLAAHKIREHKGKVRVGAFSPKPEREFRPKTNERLANSNYLRGVRNLRVMATSCAVACRET